MGRRALLAVFTALLVVTSGCAGFQSLGGDDDESPPDVDVVERYESLDTVEGTRALSFDGDSNATETRASVLVDLSTSPPRQLQRVLAPEEHAGDVTLVNSSGALMYDASNNSVTRIPQSTTTGTPRDRAAFLASIVEAARDDEVAKPADGVSPLPVVPSTRTAPEIPSDAIDGFDVTYLGTDTVAGRTAHGFELTPASEAAISIEQTLWLDHEYFYPLKTHQVLETDNRTIETTVRLTEVTFDTDLPEDAFEFDIPENATVDTIDFDSETFDSLAAVRAATNRTIPSPDVPAGYEFQQAQLFGDRTTQVSLQYVSGNGERLSVAMLGNTSDVGGGLTGGENVTVAGNDGRYVTTGQTKLLTWSCGERRYTLTASALDRDQLLAVGESIDCE